MTQAYFSCSASLLDFRAFCQQLFVQDLPVWAVIIMNLYFVRMPVLSLRGVPRSKSRRKLVFALAV